LSAARQDEGRLLSPEELSLFERDGVLLLRGLVGAAWVERLQAAAERAVAGRKGKPRIIDRADDPGRMLMSVYLWRDDPDFEDFIYESPAIGIAAQLLRTDELRFFYDQLFVKEPLTRAPTYWHHDLPFWPIRGEDVLSFWLALSPVSTQTSGLVYLAGSHRWGKTYQAHTPDDDVRFQDPALEPCPDFDREHDPALRRLEFTLEPGDVLVHHPLTLHAAGGNASHDRRRVALSSRYFGPNAYWDPRPHTMTVPETDALRPGERPHGPSFPVVLRHGQRVERPSRPSSPDERSVRLV
jgi:hypothetical protein